MMKCNFLTGNQVLTCTGHTRLFVPSLFELEKYCRSTEHDQCPLFKKQSGSGQNIYHDQSDYWPCLG